MLAVLDHAPPGPWPAGWAGWSNVIAAHKLLLAREIANLQHYPGHYYGQGILSCVSAKSGWSSGKNLPQGYFPGAYVLVKELRRLGCNLPIIFAYLGLEECDPYLQRLLLPYGVRFLDLRQLESTYPIRILAGWETKVYALLYCPFKEVLFLDADNIPGRDPGYLFDDNDYRRLGSIFWPDLPSGNRSEWVPAIVWHNLDMSYQSEPDFESGQLLVNKEKCWPELQLTKHINEHSDYYYQQIYGDKTTFHLAWAKLAKNYKLINTPAGWRTRAIIQYDPSGKPLFYHACRDKPSLQGYSGYGYLPHEKLCHNHIKELAGLWSGYLWFNDHPSAEEKALAQQLIKKKFTYNRVTIGSRILSLEADHKIGVGAASMETYWSVWQHDSNTYLALSAANKQPTVVLQRQDNHTYTGYWFKHEKNLTILEPLG